MGCAAEHCAPHIAYQIGTQIAMLYAYFMYPDNAANAPCIPWTTFYPVLYKGMIVIPISSTRAFHIHHWAFYFPFTIICAVLNTIIGQPSCENHGVTALVLMATHGFSSVMAFHGLVMFRNRLGVIVKNPYHT